jgi:hypothetical protein
MFCLKLYREKKTVGKDAKKRKITRKLVEQKEKKKTKKKKKKKKKNWIQGKKNTIY